MNLSVQSYSSSVLELIEFKTVDKSDVYFENDFGIIKGNKIILYGSNTELDAATTASFRIISRSKSYTGLSILSLTVLLLLLLIIPPQVEIISLVFFVMTIASVILFFMKRKSNFLQIVFSHAQQLVLPLKDPQLEDARNFVKACTTFRRKNFEIK